ncbi:hypothetical protein NX059_003237 [Plenodomus lindquistii]|nr:hypothetical protein NX059_003237 [Plenodomus lindquistii]
MAPNGHKASERRDGHQSHKSSCQSWLKTKGEIEFEKWQTDNPTQQLSYKEWEKSEHVAGLSLFFAAADIFNESSSSDYDEEVEPIEAEPRPRAVRTQSAREPKKKVTMYGNGLPRAASSATPTAHGNSGDQSPSGKRKRKVKKNFLSSELVDSDSESDVEQEPTVDLLKQTGATPTVPVIAVNGKRKSPGRKSKKKLLSEETISPEDELDDPMVLDEVVPPPIVSPLPVRSAPKPKAKAKTPVQTPEQASKPPKKTHILKLSTRKTPKTPDTPKVDEPLVVSEASSSTPISAAATKPSKATKKSSSAKVDKVHKIAHDPTTTPTVAAAARPNIDATPQNETPTQSVEVRVESAAVSPDPTDLAASATRRGLRTRRPAQQRPYFHDAQQFDDVEPNSSSSGILSLSRSPELRSRRASAASFINRPYDAELLAHLDAEDLAILQDDAEDEEVIERRPKTFKGKGRAWKKEESDEDEEFTLAKKKAAKAAKIARAKAKGQVSAVPKKKGRPRKSGLSEDTVPDDSELMDAGSANGSPAQSPAPATVAREGVKKARKPSRKSLLSAEIVEDSESDVDASLNTVSVPEEPAPTVASTPKSKKTAKTRKSDQSATSRSSTHQQDGNEDGEPVASTTPVSTPKKSYTPKGFRDGKPYTPKGMPRSLRLSVSDTVEGAKEDVVVPDVIAGDASADKEEVGKEEEVL